MNYPSLNNNRSVIFDPCVTSGAKLLNEVGSVASELIGLAHGPVRGDGIKLIRSTMGEAYQLLEKVGARFDLIVSAPPAGTIGAKGLPKPTKAKAEMAAPAGRKLIMSSATPVVVPEIDIGYATFLVTNALLSPFGEAMLYVTTASHDLIKKDAAYSRVWLVAELGKKDPDHVMLYVARDHRPLPGEQPMNAGIDAHETWKCYGRQGHIRGQTFNAHTGTPDSAKKFYTVRDEISRRLNETFDDYNIRLDNERLRVKFSEFQIESGAVPRSLADEAELLRNKTILDLVVMRDTRDQARRILTDKRLKVPPGVIAAFDDVCKQHSIQSAPFNRPSPVQRVAWLDEQNTIECTRDLLSFQAGQSYKIETRVITGKKMEKRHRPGFGQEEVLVTGQELIVAVIDPQDLACVFTQYEPSDETKAEIGNHFWRISGYFRLQDLVVNFKMPDVADIAEAAPAEYIKYRKRLEALQTQ